MRSRYTNSEIGQPAKTGSRSGCSSCSKILIAAALPLIVGQAAAGPIVVTEQPWGSDQDISNMTNVFGAGNFTAYTSFAGAAAASVFSPSNHFVMLEGGAATDTSLVSYLSANAAAISAWVNAGGALLIQSAGWNVDVSFNGVTLDLEPSSYSTANDCGTLTAAGAAAFTTASNQCGGYLAHDVVLGAGLTSFMTGDGNGGSLVAGSQVGLGYIMYSGLTNSQFHSAGSSLVDSVIRYTSLQANQGVPEPASLALLGIGLAGLGAMRRRMSV